MRRGQHKRRDDPPVRTHGERDLADRILAPLPWGGAREELDAHTRLGMVGTVVGAEGQDRGGGTPAERDPLALVTSLPDPAKVRGEQVIKTRRLGREECHQRVVRRLRHGGGERRMPRGRVQRRITLVAAHDRVHRVKDGDVDNGHGPARSPRSELLPKNAILAGGHRGVVEPAGVDGDGIPAPDRMALGEQWQTWRPLEGRCGSEASTEGIADTPRKTLGRRRDYRAEAAKNQEGNNEWTSFLHTRNG